LLLIPAIADFGERYPGIQLDMGVSDRVVDLIADNVDCVIRVGEITDQSLVARRIGQLSFLTVAAPAYLRRHGTPAHPRDLERSHRVVHHFQGNTRRIFPLEFDRDGEHIEPDAPYSLAVNESNAHTAAVLAGLGASQMVSFTALPHIARGELVEILPEWTREPLPVYVVYPPNRHLSAKVRAFVDWAAELFAKHPLLRREKEAAPATASTLAAAAPTPAKAPAKTAVAAA
ncbi:MAG: hypothetical protein EOO24_00005, partial [Comamonadaceae bacterium]